MNSGQAAAPKVRAKALLRSQNTHSLERLQASSGANHAKSMGHSFQSL
jgi:hypothetical protein